MSECYTLLVLGSRIEEVDFSHRLLGYMLSLLDFVYLLSVYFTIH